MLSRYWNLGQMIEWLNTGDADAAESARNTEFTVTEYMELLPVIEVSDIEASAGRPGGADVTIKGAMWARFGIKVDVSLEGYLAGVGLAGFRGADVVLQTATDDYHEILFLSSDVQTKIIPRVVALKPSQMTLTDGRGRPNMNHVIQAKIDTLTTKAAVLKFLKDHEEEGRKSKAALSRALHRHAANVAGAGDKVPEAATIENEFRDVLNNAYELL